MYLSHYFTHWSYWYNKDKTFSEMSQLSSIVLKMLKGTVFQNNAAQGNFRTE